MFHLVGVAAVLMAVLEPNPSFNSKSIANPIPKAIPNPSSM